LHACGSPVTQVFLSKVIMIPSDGCMLSTLNIKMVHGDSATMHLHFDMHVSKASFLDHCVDPHAEGWSSASACDTVFCAEYVAHHGWVLVPLWLRATQEAAVAGAKRMDWTL
jgi:hypothetical protein